jgi:adenylate cyclase
MHSRELGLPLSDSRVIEAVFSIFYEWDSIRTYLFWFLVVLATTITLLVNEKYGPGVFRDFLLGRYFRPRREERIFMFLDLRGSTALAEKLGEERFFRFIQESFRDVTPAILKYRGQIYQYVGDEIVVSWSLKSGLSQGRCVECFLEIQKILHDHAGYYQEKYGHQPEFKAGLHCGHVMAGEVGVVKREIAFSGDVLNTTARIQSKCNEMGVNILLSEKLIHALPQAIQKMARALGALPLRGKSDQVVVYTV